MSARAVVKELMAIIDYLANPCPTKDEPLGTESGPSGVPGWPSSAWDGGRLWMKTDARIARAFERAREVLNATTCDGCGRTYKPERKPAVSRQKYCARCRKNGTAARLRQRRYRKEAQS